MNFLAHPVSKRLVNQLMSLYPALALKHGADYYCLKMSAVIAFHTEKLRIHAVSDIVLNTFGSNHIFSAVEYFSSLTGHAQTGIGYFGAGFA